MAYITTDFHRDFLVCVKEKKEHLNQYNHLNNIIIHTSNDNLLDFNIYATKSLELDNEAKKRSKDEAISIHIITNKLNTRLHILYESQINEFYGKPDFIIRLGKKLYIMVSTTRALKHKTTVFNQYDAYKLIKKKLIGLSIYAKNLECFIDDIVDNYIVIPILHVLSPSIINSNLCITAYKNIIKEKKIKLSNIKVVISYIINHVNIL